MRFRPMRDRQTEPQAWRCPIISTIARLPLSCKVVCDQSQRRSNRRRTARLLTLCPTPDAPPDRSIELTYSKLKTRHRDEVDRSAGRLRELYRSVLDQSTKPECPNDFKHCGDRFTENSTALTCIRCQSLQPCLQPNLGSEAPLETVIRSRL